MTSTSSNLSGGINQQSGEDSQRGAANNGGCPTQLEWPPVANSWSLVSSGQAGQLVRKASARAQRHVGGLCVFLPEHSRWPGGMCALIPLYLKKYIHVYFY